MSVPTVSMTVLDVTMTPLERPLGLPDYAGATLRGALGQAFRAAQCTTSQPACAGCPELGRCAYGVVYEGGLVTADGPKRFRTPTSPYVLVPPPLGTTRIAPGEEVRFSVN